MTASTQSVAGPGTLAALLALVDDSVVQSLAAEDQLVAASDRLYAQRAAEFLASPSDFSSSDSEDTHPFLNAALLAAVVVLLRRAFSSGSEEGLRFGAAQLSASGIPFDATQVVVASGLIDALVRDFLAGQVEVSSQAPGEFTPALVLELAQRARTGVLVAFHGGRNEATEAVLASAVSEWTGSVHKLWVARFDLETPPCPLCVRLHGTHVPVGEDFPVPEEEPVPYLGNLSRPPRHPRCRCSLVLYLPTKMVSDAGPTPLSMVLYADQVLEMAGLPRQDFVAATMVYIKPYTRVVKGKTQQVDGYYYDVQSGLKISASEFKGPAPKQVSHDVAKSLTEKSQSAQAAAKSLSGETHSWTPGTYVIQLPQHDEAVHMVVHSDGTSTSVLGETQEDASAQKTHEYLSYWAAHGAVLEPGSHDLDTSHSDATLPPGYYLLSDSLWGGFEVLPDGNGRLYNSDFSHSIPIKKDSVKSLASGAKGKVKPAEEEDFAPEWQKAHESAKVADSVPDEIAVSEHPTSGHGDVLSQQTLFSVGSHQVAFAEGSQVYRSSSSKDTLYVLGPDGLVTKFNPQGQGVQATVVASSENSSARASLLAKLENVSSLGVEVKNSHSVPGTKSVYLGGIDLTSSQIESAIKALDDSSSSAIASVLSKVGSPLAMTDVHAVAAPYKAMFNNKTKPAFLHALHLASQKAGHTPLEKMGAVAHLEEHHGLSDHHAVLGSSDVGSIHAALHSLDAQTDHNHTDSGPGLIDVYGVTFSPEMVSAAIAALKEEKSTSVKGPLKKADSPLAGAKLAEFANAYAGTKLHYSKFKPTLIEALQASLDAHKQSAPVYPSPAVSMPAPQVEFHGVYGTKTQLLEARDFFDSIDISALKNDWESALGKLIKSGPPNNPFLQNLEWADVADSGNQDGISLLHSMNQDIHNALTEALGDKKTAAAIIPTKAPASVQAPPLPQPGPGPQVSLQVGGEVVVGSADQLQSLISQLHSYIADDLIIDDYMESGESPFTHMNLKHFAKDQLGNKYTPAYALQEVLQVLQTKLDEVSAPPLVEISDHVSIGNQQFSKSDLLKAVDLLKSEQSTSVKGPLKGELPQLAKVDLKSFAEEYTGVPLHYSKLKPAVIAALQAKADQLSDPFADGALDPASVVTKLVEPESAVPTSLEQDIAKTVAPPDHTGTWSHSSTGSTLIVNPDGSGQLIGFNGFNADYGSDSVQAVIESGAWQKVSDSHEEAPAPAESPPPSKPGVALSPLPKVGLAVENLDKNQLLTLAQSWAIDAGYGGVAALHLKTKKKSELVAWAHAWANGEWGKAYEIESVGLKNHKAKSVHPGSPLNPTNKTGFVKAKMAPAVLGEVPAGDVVPGSWLETPPHLWDSDQIDAYLLAAQMQNPTGLSHWGKKNWATSHISGNKSSTDSMSLLAQTKVAQGLHYSDPILPAAEKYLPGQVVPPDPSWPSFDPSKAAASEMTPLQLDIYLSHMGSKGVVKSLTSQPLETKQQLVQLHYVAALPHSTDAFKSPSDAKKQLTELLDKLEADVSYQTGQDISAALAETLAIKEHHYTLDPVQPFFGGGSGASMVQVVDEHGQTFIFKAAGSPYRADTEHGMHELAKLSGIQAADSRLGTWNGEFGQFQAKLDSKSSLTGVEAHTLPTSVLSDVLRSHVFDWAINNDDAHSENFLLSPNGDRAYPIDFGRGYARFGTGWMQLQLGHLSSQADLYYNRVYDDIITGKISDADADQLYADVIKQARRMEALDDAAWVSVLDQALERRPHYKTTSATDKADLIQQALSRKNSLVADFETFWDSIYVKVGRAKPEVKSSLAQHVFTGNSVEWHARALTVGAGGASSFFAGTDLEDGHLLAQVVQKAKVSKSSTVPVVKGVKVGKYYSAIHDVDVTVRSDGSVEGDALSVLGDEDFVLDLIKDDPNDWSWSAVSSDSVVGLTEDREFWLSGQLREEADAKFHAWLMSHAGGDINVSGGAFPENRTTKFLLSAGLSDIPDRFAAWAKTVSHHHKQGDKNYNTLAGTGFEEARSKLQKLTDDISVGKYPHDLPAIDVPQYEAMIQYYMDQAKAIEKIQMTGGVSHKGDFPSFEFKLSDPPAVDPPVKSPAKIKVEIKSAFLENGSHDAQGNLVTTGAQDSLGSGQVIVATLNDGTQIEYRSWHSNQAVPLAQKGMLKVKVRDYDGSAASAESAFFALRSAGLEMGDSTDEDMELLYWRHLYGVLKDRADVGSYAKVTSVVEQKIKPLSDGSSSLSKTAEVSAWREAWSHVDADRVSSFVSSRSYLPRFSHPNVAKPQEVGGQPYWLRFDVDLEQLRATNKMPVRSVSKVGAMAKVITSGGSYSTEDRMKLLGKWSAGMSSSTDQGEGSSNFVFTRLNLHGAAYQYYFRPEVLARTSNYSYATDRYGRLKDRKGHAQFNFDKATSHAGTSNETMIKHTLTLLDDMELVAFSTSQERQEAIDFLHAHGIFSIRGLPVTSRLVLVKEITVALALVNAHRKTWKPTEEDPYAVAA